VTDPRLSTATVVAWVRPNNSTDEFLRRSFEIVLDRTESEDNQRKQAIQHLHRRGYETCNVEFRILG